ncbi:MAG TPA: PHP-associated domain-containing protein [Dictyobacter sp.]|jgi:predicted metal-dependent phosphoesterase TrpH|nr:PHP-associated domain-containing protein [Dictyobacter sp.]
MVKNTNDQATNLLRDAIPGTSMLKKRHKMTPIQAQEAGKQSKADVHMHSTYSDGCGTIEEILTHVQHHTDLDVIAITDHDKIEGSLRARDLWAQGNYRFDFIVGEEVSTQDGHLLGLFLEKRIPKGLSLERSIDLIHEQGGLAIIAHPLHKFFRHSCQKKAMDRIQAATDIWFDGVETWNASFCGIYANYIAMGANRELYHLPELGNSDAHTLSGIGSGLTWFTGQSAQDLRQCITSGQTAPGGKMWDVQAYYHWVRYLMNKELREARRPLITESASAL